MGTAMVDIVVQEAAEGAVEDAIMRLLLALDLG